MNDDWEELLHRIVDYIYTRTPEQLAQLDKDLGIEEYVTPFGTLRVIRPRLFRENL